MHFSFEGFFVPGFPKLLRFQEHHDRILKKLLSRLFKNLVSFYLHVLPTVSSVKSDTDANPNQSSRKFLSAPDKAPLTIRPLIQYVRYVLTFVR